MINVKKDDRVTVGFQCAGYTTYETDIVFSVTKDKIYCEFSDYPFDRETGVNENAAFGSVKYIVTDEVEIVRATDEMK